MIKVTVICLGKLKEKYLREACEEYQKRLSRYCDLKVIELEPVRLSENPSRSEISAALTKEAEMILKKVPHLDELYTLCVEGTALSSEAFAEGIALSQSGGQGITFVIGSSYGLSEQVKALSKKRLSFSKMTFPHQLFRIMLLEQIYRAFKINEGSKYHK